MSNLIYPTLPGITFNSVRAPEFNTGLQTALSTKESRIAYQAYPRMTWTLDYELLRDYVTPSDFKALFGLYMAVMGRWDTLLYTDPVFNNVSANAFAVTDGVTTSYQVTATYQNVGGPGAPELIQNFNGSPIFSINRFGFDELLSAAPRTNLSIQSEAFDNAAWSKTTLITITANAAVAPNGSTTMDAIVESSVTSGAHNVSETYTVPSAVGTYSFSVFAKANARNFVWVSLVELTSGSEALVFFNVSTGVRGTIQTGSHWSGVVGEIDVVASVAGIFRVTITATKTNAATSILSNIGTSIVDGSSGYAGTATTVAAFIWGAQFEIAPAPTMYIATTTTAVTTTDYTLGATGLVSPSSLVNGSNWIFKWSGSFYYRVRFDDDSMDFSQFMQNFWEVKKVKLKQVKL